MGISGGKQLFRLDPWAIFAYDGKVFIHTVYTGLWSHPDLESESIYPSYRFGRTDDGTIEGFYGVLSREKKSRGDSTTAGFRVRDIANHSDAFGGEFDISVFPVENKPAGHFGPVPRFRHKDGNSEIVFVREVDGLPVYFRRRYDGSETRVSPGDTSASEFLKAMEEIESR